MAQISANVIETRNPKTVGLSVSGLNAVVRVLRSADKELAQELNREFKRTGEIIASAARANTPRRTGASQRGIRVYIGGNKRRIGGGVGKRNRRSVRNAGFRVVQTRRGGSILEFADNAPSGTKRGKSLVETLDRKYGSPGRFMWQAYDQNRSQVDAAFANAVRDAEAKLNQRMGVKVFER